MELISGHKNIETPILNMLSASSVDMFETTVEAFLLSKRELFDSKDYSKVVIPVHTVYSIAEMINVINLTFLLKKMYGSKVYLTLNTAIKKNNKNTFFFNMFGHLFEGPFLYKKIWELYEFCIAFDITKAVYYKSYPNYRSIAPDVDGFIATKTTLDWTDLLPTKLRRSISNVIHVQQYKKIGPVNTVLDHIVPFLGVRLYDDYSFFNRPVFEYSIAVKRGLIKQ